MSFINEYLIESLNREIRSWQKEVDKNIKEGAKFTVKTDRENVVFYQLRVQGLEYLIELNRNHIELLSPKKLQG